SDQRSNLYVAVPGREHHLADAVEYDHNLIVNILPNDPDKATEWDVYWAIALDPELTAEFRDEHQLILAGQSYFRPGDLYGFDDAPGRSMLTELGASSLTDLARYRRKDGSLPRMLIIPVGAAIRATVSPRDSSPTTGPRR